MWKWVRSSLYCMTHDHDLEFVRNIYGDEVSVIEARSEWKCLRCGTKIFQLDLRKE
jgi:hypothetical protein